MSSSETIAADHGDGIPSKIPKLTTTDESNNEDHIITSFDNFEMIKCLNDKPREKVMVIQGRFSDSEEDAVVLLEKQAFNEDDVKLTLSGKSALKNTLQNNIYGTYELKPPPELNTIKTTVIYPATQQHIIKWTAQEMYLVKETDLDYKNITLPHLEKSLFKIDWVYNILEKKKEADRIVYEDTDSENGFILLPDMKWSQKQTDDLYLVAIIHRHGIRSLRDLNDSHLPLLRNIRDNGQAAILNKYGLPSSKLRMYFHYQPSYYHLHVHFTHIKFNAPGSELERAHLLDDVIENIEFKSDYYQKKTLTCMLKKNETLFTRFVEEGKIQIVKSNS